jgi:hypothetical protein
MNSKILKKAKKKMDSSWEEVGVRGERKKEGNDQKHFLLFEGRGTIASFANLLQIMAPLPAKM